MVILNLTVGLESIPFCLDLTYKLKDPSPKRIYHVLYTISKKIYLVYSIVLIAGT